jgi:hypothetical protein
MSKIIKKEMSVSRINHVINPNWEFRNLNLNSRESYLNNPFKIEGIVLKGRSIKGRVRNMVDDDGEVRPWQEADTSTQILHDEKKFIKTFVDGKDLVRKLSFNGMKGFLYCTYHLPLGKDVIYLLPGDVGLWCGIGKTTYFRVIKELLDFRIIARKVGTHLEFFVNPNIIYNGNRVRLYEKNNQNILVDYQ